MTYLGSKKAFNTPAGTIMAPEWLDPWIPTVRDDLTHLRRHMLIVGIPKELWAEWSEAIGYDKVYDIPTVHSFFWLWILVCKYQATTDCDILPQDEMGFMVYEQLFDRERVSHRFMS